MIGEDFGPSPLRDRVATERFGLRAIAIDPPQHDADPIPPFALHARWDGPAAAVAVLPAWYSADPAAARDQLAAAATAGHAAGARSLALVANLVVPGRTDPVVVAWEDGEGEITGLVTHDPLPYTYDPSGRVRVAVPPDDAAWALPLTSGRAARALDRDDADAYLPRDHEASYAVVVCDSVRCALVAVVVFE